MAQYDKNLIDIYKKFPDQNPNPILRLSIEGILEYHNQPSKHIINFFGLKKFIRKLTKVSLNISTLLFLKEHTFEMQVESSFFTFKCIYVEEINGINIYGTNITARKVIDKFPDNNPNPVLRVSYKGILNYFNHGSTKLVEDLKLKVSRLVPKIVLQYVGEVSITGKPSNYEIKVGNHTYLCSLFQFLNFNL